MTESLIVELEAQTRQFDQSINNSTQQVNEFSDEVGGADSSLNRLSKTAGAVGKGLAVMATAGLAVASAMTAVIVNSAQANREVELLARQTKLTTDEFDALAFATKQYGINAEQIADISKDLSDKLGEFTKTGKGAFQDFADVVGLSKEQAFLAAKEFENMSSDQVIGEMVRRMEEAGATTNEMTFALESMGNDLSKLQPLFANNSAELKTLTERYNDVNQALSLTNGEARDLQKAATSFDLLTTSMGNAAELVSAQLAPMLDEFFNGVIDVVPRATQVVVDFINTFKRPEDITQIKGLENQITDSLAKLQELRIAMSNNEGEFNFQWAKDYQAVKLDEQFKEEADRLEELREQLRLMNEEQAKTPPDQKGGRITATGGRLPKFTEAKSPVDQIAERFKSEKQLLIEKFNEEIRIVGDNNALRVQLEKELQENLAALKLQDGEAAQAVADRFKSEEELLIEKFYAERELIAEDNELKLQLEQELRDNLTAIRLDAAEEQMKIDEEVARANERAKNSEVKAAQKAEKQKAKADQEYYNAAVTLGEALLGDSKAVKSGLVVVDTAAGISKSFAELPYPAALAASASIAATGVAQLAAIQGASKGGGASPTASAASPVSASDNTSSANVSSTDASGKGVSLQVSGDSGELIEAIVKALRVGELNGDF